MPVLIPLRSNFNLHVGESHVLHWTITDDAGTAVDLTGCHFKLIGFTRGRDTTGTMGLASRLFTLDVPNRLKVRLPTQLTSIARSNLYGLWDTTNDRILAFGRIEIEATDKTL